VGFSCSACCNGRAVWSNAALMQYLHSMMINMSWRAVAWTSRLKMAAEGSATIIGTETAVP